MDIATREQDEGAPKAAPETEQDAPPAEVEVEAEAEAEAEAVQEVLPGTEEPAKQKRKRRLGPGQKKSDKELSQELFALLFASPEVLSKARLVELLERPEPARVDEAVENLAKRITKSRLPVVLKELAGGWRLLTDPAEGEALQRLKKEPKPERISSAALETLAIVAYRQPVTKAEIEAIRGVQSGALLRALVDRGLVRVNGRAELPGSPLQYGTTKDFLDRFGLASLKDLPRDGELNSD